LFANSTQPGKTWMGKNPITTSDSVDSSESIRVIASFEVAALVAGKVRLFGLCGRGLKVG